MTSEEITFPDSPRSELERTIEDLVESAQRVLATQSRLRNLLRANRVVVEGLELPEVLQRIAQAAVELVEAQYGALGVIGHDGGLDQFIHVGLAEQDATAIGHLPEGHGLLGAVIATGEAIRLEHLHDDPRSAGFPAHHPGMDAFLGVPIRVRDEVFGNLYLTNPASGAFTQEDEELVSVLAATAGIAIENARLFDEARRRERWSAASARVTAEILNDESDALPVIADEVARLVDADLVCIVVPTGNEDELRVAVARGADAEQVRGRLYPAAGSIVGRSLASNEPMLTDGLEAEANVDWQPRTGPTFVVPLTSGVRVIGALTVSRHGAVARFSAADLELATEFAAQASVAIEIARGRRDRVRLELSEDRGRIARDLHDHVIQRLFAAGLSLQSTAGSNPDVAPIVLEQVDAIDTAIAEIRTVVFALSGRDRGQTLRHRLLDLVSELGENLGASPRLSFLGPVDLLVRAELAEDVVAVVRESLTNVARHAGAARCDVEVAVEERGLRIRVDDDGVGYAPGDRASGTANLAKRAEQRGGEYSIAVRPEGGTRVLWSAPLGEESP